MHFAKPRQLSNIATKAVYLSPSGEADCLFAVIRDGKSQRRSKMKKFLSIILAAALCLGLMTGALAADTPTVPSGAAVAVIVTSNLRGDIDYYPQLAALKADYESKGLEVILADGGNFLRGSVYAASDFGGTIVDLMNEVGYAVAGVGEQEFGWGNASTGSENHGDLKQYRTLLDFAAADGVKLITATVLNADGDLAFAPYYTVTTKSGFDITFVGATVLSETKNFADDSIFAGYTLLSGESATFASNAAYENASGQIVGLAADPSGEPTVEVMFYNASGSIVGENYAMIPVEFDGTSPVDTRVAKRVADLKDEQKNAPSAYSDVTLVGASQAACKGETNLGDLWTDALRWFATEGGIENYFEEDDISAGNAKIAVDDAHVVALWNGGNLRADIQPGLVTSADLATVLPYPNKVAVVYMTGAQLVEALEAASQGLPYTGATASTANSFMQVSGIEYSVDISTEFDGGEKYGEHWRRANSIGRVSVSDINGAPLDETATYAVITSNANYNGMDSSYIFREAQEADVRSAITTAVVRDVVWLYIKNELNGAIDERYAEPQGRVSIDGYVDIPADALYLDAIEFVGEHKLMNGTGEGRFEPNAPMTRATFATVLWRYAGSPKVENAASFTDADESWYLDAIAWAESTGAIKGYGNGCFGCDDPVTREDAATILWRLCGEPNDIAADRTFSDADAIFDYAATAVAWACSNGILETDDAGAIQPKREANRAELAVLLMNYDVVVRSQGEE